MSRVPDGFRHEVREQLRSVGNGLVEIEADPDPDPDAVDELFRAAHSLKGSCAMVDLDGASRLAHAIEDALDAVRAGEIVPSERLIDDALTAVDEIDAALDAFETGEPIPDPESARSRLRATIDAERESVDSTSATESATEGTPAEGPTSGSGTTDRGAVPSPPAARQDISVEEALERASVFDDLDALTAELDEDDAYDDLARWGRFDEASDPADREDAKPVDEPNAATADGAEERDALNPGTILFEEVKAEVESDGGDGDLDALEADIEAAEFGEFDEQDELTIEELLAADPADVVESEDQDIGAGEVADDSDEPTSFEEVAASVEPDDDLERLDSDIDAEEFGEFDDEDVFTIPELVEAEPEDLDEERAFDQRQGGDATEEVEPIDPTPDAPTGEREQSDDVDPFFTPDIVEDGADADGATDADQTIDANRDVDGVAADDGLEAGTGALLDDAAASLDGDDHADQNSSAAETAGAPAPIDPDAAGEVDVDTAMADLDELVNASGIDEQVDDADTETGETFARDADVEAFEERFSGLFGESPEDGASVGLAATTLEASTLDIEADEAEASRDTTGIEGIGSVTVDVGVADALLRSVEELSRNHMRLERTLHEAEGPTTQEVLSELRTVTAGLRETVMNVRLMPLSAVTDDLPRVLRTAARETNTAVTLDVDGAAVTLDRGIIDRLGDPLAHLLRNAVAHGIESPAEREAVGKPREGTVTIRARRRRDRVHIDVVDDGRGLDPGRIRQTAIDQGILTEEEAAALTLEEAYELIFHPGFTTTEEVTEVSGRGVGLDVVDRTVTELNGTVEVDSEPGEGTTVRLSLPMSVAVAEVLFVQVGDEEFAIRLSAIERVGKPGEIEVVDGREMVTFDSLVDDTVRVRDGATGEGGSSATPADGGDSSGLDSDGADRYPLLRLSEAFDTVGRAGDASTADGVLVQLRSDLRDLVLYCDDFGGTREVVVDPYTGVLGGVPGLSGTTTRGDGSLVNVLDIHTLYRH